MPTIEQLHAAIIKNSTREQLLQLRQSVQALLNAIDHVESTHRVNPILKRAKEA